MVKKRNGSNIYYTDFYAGGRRVRISTGTSIRKDAERFELKKRQEYYNRESLKRYLWRDAVVRYLKTVTNRNHHTKDHILHFKYLDKFLGDLYLDEINGDLISRIIETRQSEGVKSSTINRLLGSLSGVLNMAYKNWQWIDKLPPIQREKEPNPRDHVLSKEESDQLIDHAAEHLKPIISFALQTGLRRGNILNLKWAQVDINNKVIKILAKDFKNRTEHTQLISDETTALLKSIQNASPINAEYVFTYKGEKIKSIKTAFNSARQRSSIAPCRFHDLRRTQATRLRAAGVNAENIQALNGWKDIKTALKYAIPREDALRLELEKLSDRSQIQSHCTEESVLH